MTTPEMKSGKKSSSMTFRELCENLRVNVPEPVDLSPGTENGFVVPVDPADLQKVWKLIRETQAQHPGQQFTIGVGLFQRVCSPGADTKACWYRSSMLSLLQEPMGLLSRWLVDGGLDERVFNVAASFPMKPMNPSTPQQGLPFDVNEFLHQVEQATA